jgi:UDP-N-acetylglucosamine 2-epimerase (non-hydrolysing)
MKVLTVFGTRPEIIRLSRIIPLLDRHSEQILLHTGQNYDPSLSEVFLNELAIRKVDYHLGIRSSSFGEQVGLILSRADDLLETIKPDRLLILGDTNSALTAIVAARRGIPVYHLEAGNRCYDNRVPEEVNRRIVDHSSDVLLTYTHRSAANLVAEGIRRDRIFVVGNPILEVMEHFDPEIRKSDVLKRLGIREKEYFAVTMHRSENVDIPERLLALLDALQQLARKFSKPAIVSVHPRTADRVRQLGFQSDEHLVRLEKPFGFFDFLHLERSAFGVVTDSGTVQEEVCIFGIPNVTIRDVTERPEALECGSNFLSGQFSDSLITGMDLALATGARWEAPEEYRRRNVAATVAKIVLSFRWRGSG